MIRVKLFSLSIGAAIGVLLISMIAGCGGGDSGSSASGEEGGITTSSLTRAQFIKRADEICSRKSEQFLTLLITYMKRHSRPNQSEGEAAAVGVQEVLLPIFQTQVKEIRALGAPAGDEKEIEAFLDAFQQGIASLEKRHTLSLETQLDREFHPSEKLAVAYGLHSCV